MKKVWKNPLGHKVYGWRPPTGKKRPRAFDESREPISAGALKIHRDGTFSVKVLRPNRRRRWIWLRGCDSIEQRDFARLSVKDRKRLRAGQIPITPDELVG
jgi:hypothetical protein